MIVQTFIRTPLLSKAAPCSCSKLILGSLAAVPKGSANLSPIFLTAASVHELHRGLSAVDGAASRSFFMRTSPSPWGEERGWRHVAIGRLWAVVHQDGDTHIAVVAEDVPQCVMRSYVAALTTPLADGKHAARMMDAHVITQSIEAGQGCALTTL